MERLTTIAALMLLTPLPALGAGNDDPLLASLMFDQLEYRDTAGHNPMVWGVQGWVGKDLNKLWLKTEGERAEGVSEEVELQLLYGRAITPYWDLLLGWRHDNLPRPVRDWAIVTLQGLAPYWIETDASLFLGESGHSAIRFEVEYELMLTQKWVLSPEIELNLYGKSDSERGVGSGLSDAEIGLRLRYEIRREFAPYIGVNWEKLFGDTADLARDEGEKTEQGQWVIGIRAWF